MEHEKIINLLDNTPNQISKFRTKSWVEISDESRGMYDTGRQCEYSDAYILAKGTSCKHWNSSSPKYYK